MNTIYKDIKGYEGLYQINRSGEVISLAKQKGSVFCKEKQLKYDIGKAGYVRVTLCKNSAVKKFYVHRLVFETFIGEIPKGMQIHHIDEKKHNNHISNLMLTTVRENNHYSRVIKGYKLTEGNVDEIRSKKFTVKQCVEKFGISPRHALRVINNERWVN